MNSEKINIKLKPALKKTAKFLLLILVVIFLAGAVFLGFNYKPFAAYLGGKIGNKNVAAENNSKPGVEKNNENIAGNQNELPSQETIASQNVALAESENYQLKSLKFGGDAALAMGAQENVPLEISDIKSESFAEKKNDTAKIILSWTTNKLATSEIEYGKNNGQSSKIFREDGYGFNHSVVISGLDQATAYVYSIKSSDHWGNTTESGYYGAYTSSKEISIFELIGKAAGEIFGWAVGKK